MHKGGNFTWHCPVPEPGNYKDETARWRARPDPSTRTSGIWRWRTSRPSTTSDGLPMLKTRNSQSTKVRQRLRLRFTGTGGEYFRIWIVNLFLTVLTLGIYSAWAKVRTRRYFYANTLLADHPFDYRANPWYILRGNLILGFGLLLFLAFESFGPVYSGIVLAAFYAFLPFLIYKSLRFNAVQLILPQPSLPIPRIAERELQHLSVHTPAHSADPGPDFSLLGFPSQEIFFRQFYLWPKPQHLHRYGRSLLPGLRNYGSYGHPPGCRGRQRGISSSSRSHTDWHYGWTTWIGFSRCCRSPVSWSQ